MSYLTERRQEEKERRRNEILDAAERVAAEAGIDAMIMDQVARQARLSRALLYVYFRDKPDLLFGLSERAFGLLRTRFVEAAGRHRLGIERIEAIGRAYVAFALEFPVYFELLGRFQAYEAQPGEAAGNLQNCALAANRVQEVIVEALRKGGADGSLRADAGDPAILAFALYGFMHGTVQLATAKAAVLPSYGVTPKALIEQAIVLARRSIAARP